MKWILGVLDLNDQVVFKTDITEDNQYLSYYKFLGFIFPHIKERYEDLLLTINRFQTFFIDVENKSWEIYKPEFDKPSFEELFKLNTEKQMEKERKALKTKDEFYPYRNLIQNIVTRKHLGTAKSNFLGDLK